MLGQACKDLLLVVVIDRAVCFYVDLVLPQIPCRSVLTQGVIADLVLSGPQAWLTINMIMRIVEKNTHCTCSLVLCLPAHVEFISEQQSTSESSSYSGRLIDLDLLCFHRAG